MSTTDAILAAVSAGVPALTAVLAGVLGAIRYLVRILASIERVTTVAESAADQIAAHIVHSDAAHAAHAAKASEHDIRLAAIDAKLSTGGGQT